jgi:branched-chain amino acid aminotransferase
MIVWVDGALVPLAAARVSPLDRGLTVGDGVFETLRTYRGAPFAWRRHYERLVASARGLGLAVPASETLLAATRAVIDANSLVEARVRITVTAGEGPPGSSRGDSAPLAIVVATRFVASAETTAVVVAPWTRNEHSATAGLKTLSYAANVRALAFAEARGASEALFANTAGDLCEATGSNVFVVLDGVLCTPPATSGCLLGVTRALLLEVAAESGIEAKECALALSSLGRAAEAFLTSTTREVQPITAIDGVQLPRAPGPVTAQLADAFQALVARHLDP